MLISQIEAPNLSSCLVSYDRMHDNVVRNTPNIQSESLHREAYNAVFREFDVDYNWSPEYYDELQNKVCVFCL